MSKARRRKHQNLEVPIMDSSDNKAFISHSLRCQRRAVSLEAGDTPSCPPSRNMSRYDAAAPCVFCLCVGSETERACKVIKAPSRCRLMGELLHFTAV